MRRWRPVLVIALHALFGLASVALAPALPVSRYADAVAAAWSVLPALAALFWLSRPALPAAHAAICAALGLIGLVAVDSLGLTAGTLWLQPVAVTTVAFAVDDTIERQVRQPAHLLPALALAAAVDTLSVLSPSGVSHAVVESERAISLLVLAAPVPGTDAITFVLGVGDLIVLALVLATVARFQLSHVRAGVALLAGVALALAASAVWQRAVPALVTIALTVALAFPELRRPRANEARLTGLVVAASAAAVIFALLWHR